MYYGQHRDSIVPACDSVTQSFVQANTTVQATAMQDRSTLEIGCRWSTMGPVTRMHKAWIAAGKSES
jgi:hypothetical protein